MVIFSASVVLGPIVIFLLSKTERTTHTWEDLWNPPQLSTGTAVLLREPQVVRVFTIWSIRICMLLKDERLQLWGRIQICYLVVYRMWTEGNRMSVPPEAAHATFGPAKQFWPGSRRGSVLDGWLPIQCCSEGKGRIEIYFSFVACGLNERVWLLWCTPAGLNLFEKPCPRLWTTWVMCWLKRSQTSPQN